MHLLRIARRIARICVTALAVVAMVAVAGMMLTITYDVVARSLFRAPTDWAYPLNALGVLCVTALPVPYLYLHHGHIAMDLIHRTLPMRWQTAANAVTTLAVVAFGVVVALTAALSLPVAVDAGLTGSGTFNIPFWIHDLVLIVSGSFLAVVAMLFPVVRSGSAPAAAPTKNDTPTTEDEVSR